MDCPLPGALPVEEGSHHGEGRIQPAHRVADREARAQGVQALVAIDRHLAGKTLDDLVICGLEGIRPRLAEA